MSERFFAEMFTPDVVAAQQRYYGRSYAAGEQPPADELGPDERAFIAARDSFYMATVTTSGWPYIQHRGGPPGFLKVVDPRRLAFADLRGNRQLVSTGNLAGSDRVALFLMDYPHRLRLKLLGHARVVDARDEPELADELCPAPELRKRVERLISIEVVAFDWNCAAYITPRFTVGEIEQLVASR